MGGGNQHCLAVSSPLNSPVQSSGAPCAPSSTSTCARDGVLMPSTHIRTGKYEVAQNGILGCHSLAFGHRNHVMSLFSLKHMLAGFFQTANVPDLQVILQNQRSTDTWKETELQSLTPTETPLEQCSGRHPTLANRRPSEAHGGVCHHFRVSKAPSADPPENSPEVSLKRSYWPYGFYP